MPVFRVERTKNFTVMSNHHLRDKTISLKAKGLLSQMLSLPNDWDYTLRGLPPSTKKALMPFALPFTNWRPPDMSSVPASVTSVGSFAAAIILSTSIHTSRIPMLKTVMIFLCRLYWKHLCPILLRRRIPHN